MFTYTKELFCSNQSAATDTSVPSTSLSFDRRCGHHCFFCFICATICFQPFFPQLFHLFYHNIKTCPPPFVITLLFCLTHDGQLKKKKGSKSMQHNQRYHTFYSSHSPSLHPHYPQCNTTADGVDSVVREVAANVACSSSQI